MYGRRGGRTESNGGVPEDRSTDIARLLGRSDPWYERNVLSLLSLSSDVLCQTACKDADEESASGVETLPLLADLVLYYCRHADQPVLVQLYQAELTLAGGERRREVFIHSLELGHTAGTRAVKAMDARIESLQLTMTEVLKRQSAKSKKGCNQHISVSEVKVDGGEEGTTFAVCLDQDEKKFIQRVTSSDWRSYKPSPGQVQPLHPSYCSLLCLPITSFSASSP
ncbi:Phosphoinositide 3-kinase regulatory subunit 5 [Liparis tanakae]|uniref:Phosphoinositide 3-kinase regulatory subunit 5 n=1 Tax=Liparis tanakae TaxID=230148 RepID=A0A4Z2H1Y1_9TELE|nr:Phosphoinositide 3-kinase regulatory subunit 5 [Liparis tanakae]